MRTSALIAALVCASLILSSASAVDLSLTSSSYETAVVGQPFSYAIIAAPASATSYSAVGLPASLTLNATTGVISGMPTATATLLVAISANDASGSATKTLRIDVNADSSLVIVDPGTLLADVGTAFNYQVVATGSPTTYTAAGLPPGIAINPTTGFISGTPTLGGAYPVSLIASSATSKWVTSLTIDAYPMVPVVSDRTITATVNASLRLDISGSNVPTAYAAGTLPTGLNLDASTGIITGVPTVVGTTSVTVSASNAGGTGTATWTVVINPSGVGTITIPDPVPDAVIGTPYTLQISANGSPTGYTASGLPNGLAISPTTGQITGTPSAGTGGSYTVLISAAYAAGAIGNAFTLAVDPQLATITMPTTIPVIPGVAFTDAVITTTSVADPPTAYSATGLPSGLTIDPALGIISGTTTQVGSGNATISATNAGGTASATVAVVVPSLPSLTGSPAGGAPVIANALSATAVVGTPFSLGIVATNAPTAYTATGLPTGLAVSASTGIISGTPTVVGSYPVQIGCSNGSGLASATITIFVLPVPLTTITSSLTHLYLTVGTPFTYQVLGTYGVTAYTATGLPFGLSINGSTGLISGTPTTTGTFNATLSVTNAAGTVSGILSCTVQNAPLATAVPVFTEPTSLVAEVGTLFTATLTNNNGTATSYSATGLPGWLLFNTATGQLSGTPGAGDVTIASAITVTGTNTSGSLTLPSTVIVNPAASSIITSPLTTITVAVNQPISYTITATSPSTVTFSASGLPPGVTVDASSGALVGSPTAGGVYLALISANAAGSTWTEPLTIKVTPSPPVITTASLGTGRVGDFLYTTVSGTNAPTGYAASGLPTGITVDPVFGVLSGVPTVSGTYSVTISATNAGGTGQLTLPLVINPSATPTITSPSTIYTTPNAPFTYQITALNAPTSFGAAGLPAGVSIDTTTGLISGSTAALGSVQAVISAANADSTRSALLDIVTVSSGSPGAPGGTANPPQLAGGGGGGCGLGTGIAGLISLLAAALMRQALVRQTRAGSRSA